MLTTYLSSAFELTDRDLDAIVQLVYENSGIRLHEGKRALITARLQKRLKRGGFGSFKEYVRYVQADDSGEELTALLDAIATNHTAFFREPQHFDFLRRVVLPPLASRGDGLPIRAWCAGCATGEEPYTIGIVAFEHFGWDAGYRLRLLASDLSTKALSVADAGWYREERVTDLPRHLVLKYFQKGLGLRRGLVQVADALRQTVEFRQLNLLDSPPNGPPFHFIFCRNVMIYFDLESQQRALDGLERSLAPGGYLFTSHSEGLSRLRHRLTWIAPAVYRKGNA